jgi:hypothetical protein
MLQVSHTIPVTFNSLFTVSLTGSSAPLSVKAGQSAIDSLLVLPVGSNTFVTAVSFTCNGLPFGATCSSPLIPAGANGAQTVSLVISTSGPATSAIGSHMQSRISKTFLLIWTSTTGMLLGGLSRKPKSAKKAVRVGIIGLAMISILLMPSCGGGNASSSQTSSTIAVTINPPTATPFTLDRQQFTAIVTGTTNTQVQWQVNGVNGGNTLVGTIDKDGMYTAPAVVPSPATVSVSAVSLADVAKFATANVTVQAPVVLVTPPTSGLFPTQQQQFAATVHGLSSTQVSWQISGATGDISKSGSIDPTGLYTAPSIVPNPPTVPISAVSNADNTKVGTAVVTIKSPIISVSPKTAALYPTQQQQFTVSGDSTSNTQVTWQVNGAPGGGPSVGTVDSTGLFTAPTVVPTPNVPILVSAISLADVTKSDTAAVTIKAPTPSGTYTVTITATVGSLTQSTTAMLVVE